jgi:hypothetical protein
VANNLVKERIEEMVAKLKQKVPGIDAAVLLEDMKVW